MEIKNLWGDIIPQKEKSPVEILEEQARILAQITDNLLSGDVITKVSSDRVMASLYINCDSINYSFELLSISHQRDSMYPVIIESSRIGVRCDTEEKFISNLETIFQEKETKRTFKSLMTQATKERNYMEYWSLSGAYFRPEQVKSSDVVVELNVIKHFKEVGNLFKTKEEALIASKKMKEFLRSINNLYKDKDREITLAGFDGIISMLDMAINEIRKS